MVVRRGPHDGAVVMLFVAICVSRGDTSNLHQLRDSNMMCFAENMNYWTCHWPSQPGVTYTLTVTPLLVEEQERPSYDCNADCDDQTCHCYIPPKIFYPYMDHSLILNAKLEDEVMGSYFERRALRSLARSGPVSDLDVATVHETTLNITWKRPSDLHYIYNEELSFFITYQSEWGKISNITVNEMWVELRDLEPYTIYTVDIYAFIDGSTHAGNVTSIQGRTLETEPTASPALVTYRRLNCDNSSCFLVYWQPIPRRHQNGEMLEYVIRAEANNTQYDDVRMTFSLDKPDAALIRDINPHSSYNLSVRGRNAAGWSPHNDMAILATDNVPGPFTEIHGESSSDGTSLTFLWRKLSEIEQLVLMSVRCPDDDVISCQANMEIRPLDLTAGQYSVSNSDHQRRYGAVAIVEAVNTGLAEQWACLFTYDGVPAEPSLSVLNTTHTSISVSMNFGACSHNLADNHGVALTLELMYGANDVCDKVGHVYMYLEGDSYPAGGPYRHTLQDLAPDTEYILCLQAIGRTKKSSVYSVNERTKAGKNIGIVVSVFVAVVVVALAAVVGIVKIWKYYKNKLKVSVEKPDLSLPPVVWHVKESDVPPIYDVPREPVSKKHSQDSGYSDYGSSGYCSSNQSESQTSGTGTLPDDSSGSQTDVNNDSTISAYSTIVIVEDGDALQRDSVRVFEV